MQPRAAPSLRYLSIEVTARGIAEYTGETRSVFLPMASVRSVRLERGPTAERPRLTMLAALVALGLGLAALVGYLLAPVKVLSRLALFGPMMLVLGGYLAWITVRSGPYLRVELEREVRKLAIHGAVDEAALEAFLERARAECGLPR